MGNSSVTGEFPSQGQWRRTLMFSWVCAWTNGWVNNRDAGALRRHRAHCDVTGMDVEVYIPCHRMRNGSAVTYNAVLCENEMMKRMDYISDTPSTEYNTSTLIYAGAWKTKPRRVIIYSKNQNKDNIHKCWRWSFYCYERIFAITSCYVPQWGSNKAIILFSNVSLVERWFQNVLSS